MTPRFSAVLLVGGKSTRMGRDKAFLKIGEVPLWRRQIQVLQSLAPAELLISGAAREQWREFETVSDAVPDAGPLGGIVASLRRCQSSLLLVLAVDMPKMRADFLKTLIFKATPGVGVVPQLNGRFEPLAAIYPVELLPLAERSLAERCFSMQRLIHDAIARQLMRDIDVQEAEAGLFANVNFPADAENLTSSHETDSSV